MKNCVYRFINDSNEIIYIGKAKDLELRLKSHTHLPKECYEERNKIEYVTFGSEDEMDFAERYYVPKVKPKYNTVYKYRELNIDLSEFDNVQWSLYIPPTSVVLREQIKIERQILQQQYEEELRKEEEEERKKYEYDTKNKKVIVSNTGEIFDNMESAAKYFNMKVEDVYELVEGKKLGWKHHPKYYSCLINFIYYDFYLEWYNSKPKYWDDLHDSYMRKIICLTTDEVFDNVYKIEYEYGIQRHRVAQCCNNKRTHYAGTYNNKPLVWAWYDEYETMTKNDIVDITERAYELFKKRNPKLFRKEEGVA